jgi:hypothetical protein
MVARVHDPGQNVPQFGLVVDQPQQGFAAGALNAHAEDVLGGGIEVEYEQARIEYDDARAQRIEDAPRGAVPVIVAAAAAAVASGVAAQRALTLTVLCCT